MRTGSVILAAEGAGALLTGGWELFMWRLVTQRGRGEGECFTFVDFKFLAAKTNFPAASFQQTLLPLGIGQAIGQLFARAENLDIHVGAVNAQFGRELIGVHPALAFAVQSAFGILRAVAGELQQ